MNDFDYENMQKKRVAQSARHRVCGSKSRKCMLPSDNLTPAQRNALNGEVKTWNLDEPMDWDHFKEAAPGLKQEYIRQLHERFNVGVNTISVDLFGLSKMALANHLRVKHVIHMGFSKGTKMTKTDRAVWENWLARDQIADTGEMVEEPIEEEQPEPVCTPPVDTCEKAEAPAFGMDSLTVEWMGEFDPVAFVEQLRKLPFPGGKVKIRLEVKGWTL